MPGGEEAEPGSVTAGTGGPVPQHCRTPSSPGRGCREGLCWPAVVSGVRHLGWALFWLHLWLNEEEWGPSRYLCRQAVLGVCAQEAPGLSPSSASASCLLSGTQESCPGPGVGSAWASADHGHEDAAGLRGAWGPSQATLGLLRGEDTFQSKDCSLLPEGTLQ